VSARGYTQCWRQHWQGGVTNVRQGRDINTITNMTTEGTKHLFISDYKQQCMQTRHTNSRPSDISVQKAKERKRNAEEQRT